MKTTLNIPDEIMRELKREAADSARTLSDVVADTLQKGLSGKGYKGGKLKKLRTFRCGRVFVNVADREQLYRAMEGK